MGNSSFLHCLLLSLFFSLQLAEAHPVSQGAMTITVHPDRIDLKATVSLEEVLVATAGSKKNNKAALEAIREHGQYLLSHLQISADGKPVPGQVLEIPEQPAGQLAYRLEYRLADRVTKRIEFRQNVLRELNFAPGNPWEASYLVKIGLEGQTTSEGILFTFREPLIFDSRNPAGKGRIILFGAFVRHGIAHIITGYDHLLFVAALVLAATGWRDLLKVIAVFTLAHTLTLVLAVLNIFRLPSGVVEPIIALSIVAVAAQNVFWPERSHGRGRLLLAFVFGLFHGLGFAGGLLEAMSGMAPGSVALAIIAFSAGVEMGHLIVVLPVFWSLSFLHGIDTAIPRLGLMVQRYGSFIITLFGLMYFYATLP